MPSDSKLTKTDDGFLIISKVERSDAGRYKCSASIGIESSSAYGDLQVLGEIFTIIDCFIINPSLGYVYTRQCRDREGRYSPAHVKSYMSLRAIKL